MGEKRGCLLAGLLGKVLTAEVALVRGAIEWQGTLLILSHVVVVAAGTDCARIVRPKSKVPMQIVEGCGGQRMR
jgi:hypothetical protein